MGVVIGGVVEGSMEELGAAPRSCLKLGQTSRVWHCRSRWEEGEGPDKVKLLCG